MPKKCNQVGVEAPEELIQDETVMAAIISHAKCKP
jgi:hypothetical protein